MIKKYCLLLIVSFVFLHLHAQKRYVFKNYTVNDGLINNSIFSINQDKEGFIYFATDAGVSRFDGYVFNNDIFPEINKNDAFVEYIDKDFEGNIIISSFGQGVFFQQADNSFKQQLFEPKTIGKNVVNTTKSCKNGDVLIGASRYLYKYYDNKFDLLHDFGINKRFINSIEIDETGNIWTGGYGGLKIFFKENSFKNPFNIEELKDKYIVKILFENKNKLLIATSVGYYELNITKLSPTTVSYQITQPFDILKNVFINHLFIDKKSQVWISTSTLGVFVKANDNIIDNIFHQNGLNVSSVLCTFQDNQGVLWFGTSMGIFKLSTLSTYSFNFKNENLKITSPILKDAFGRYVFTDKKNLFVMKDNVLHVLDVNNTPLKKNGIEDILISPDNNLWIENNFNLFKIPITQEGIMVDKIQVINELNKYAEKQLGLFTFDNDNNLWLGFDNEIINYNNGKVQSCEIKIKDAYKLRPNKMVKDKFGYYWMSDFNYGLYRMKLQIDKNGKLHFDNVKTYKSLKRDSAFVTAWITDLKIDKNGNLWQTTMTTGIYKHTLSDTGIIQSKLFSVENGISGNTINSIFLDYENNIWLGTYNGADIIKSDNESKIFHFSMPNDIGKQVYAVYPDITQTLVSLDAGLFVFSKNIDNDTKVSTPKVIILDFKVFQQSMQLQNNNTLELKSSQNYISFNFVSINLKKENCILYQYKLDGLDEDWNEFSDRRFVSFNALKPGKYAFRVRAKNENNIIGKETTFKFIILKPFYKTYWFLGLVTLLIIGIIYIIYNYRVNQLLKIERMRNQIASDLHDDIGSTLSSISILSEILGKQLPENSTPREIAGKIGLNSSSMLESMDDIIWAVNPKNDRFKNLSLRIKEYAVPLFEMKGINYKIIFPDNIDELQLNMEIRKNIYLIAKESVNNILKHSECKEAQLLFNYDKSLLTLKIVDNGKGFDLQSPTSRNGVNNIKQRANKINANVEIDSSIGNGTKIEITVKII